MDNQTSNLPELRGTEKQVRWATDIRDNILTSLAVWDGIIEQAASLTAEETISLIRKTSIPGWCRDLYEEIHHQHRVSPYDKTALLPVRGGDVSHGERVTMCQRFLAALKSQDQAGWWIEHRSDWLVRFRYDLRDAIFAAPETAVTDAEQEILDEMTLWPENPVSKSPASVSVSGGTVCTGSKLRSQLHSREFRAAVLPHSVFNDSLSAWLLENREANGSPRDRAAEQINRLLAAGIPVFCADQQLRENALNANFEPVYPRWLLGSRRSEFLKLRFDDDDPKLIEELNEIPQVIQRHGKYLLHTDQWEIARYLQDEFGFRTESAAEKRLTDKQRLQAKTVTVLPVPPAARPVIADSTPSGVIDRELADDD